MISHELWQVLAPAFVGAVVASIIWGAILWYVISNNNASHDRKMDAISRSYTVRENEKQDLVFRPSQRDAQMKAQRINPL